MTDIEKKAREYAEQIGREYEYDGRETIAKQAFLVGASYALGNQWRDANTDLPEWNKDVVVACQIPNRPEIEYCVGYHNRGWYLEDEDLDAIGEILAWLPIPDYEPKAN